MRFPGLVQWEAAVECVVGTPTPPPKVLDVGKGTRACWHGSQRQGQSRTLASERHVERRENKLLVEETGTGTEFPIKTSDEEVQERRQKHNVKAGNKEI